MATDLERCLALTGDGATALTEDRFSDAERICQEAVELADSLCPGEGDDLLPINLFHLSRAQEAQGDMQAALESVTGAFDALDDLGDGWAQLAVMDQLAALAGHFGSDRRVISTLQAAVGLGAALGDDAENQAARYSRLHAAFANVGLYEHSACAVHAAIEIVTQQCGVDWPELSFLFIDLGMDLLSLHRPGDAYCCQREALRLFEASGIDQSAMLALPVMNLGRIAMERGDLARAERELRRAVEFAGGGGQEAGSAGVKMYLADCRRRQGALEEAGTMIREAVAALDRQPAALAEALEVSSRIQEDLGGSDPGREDRDRLEEALREVRRAREICQKQASPNLTRVAELMEREAGIAQRIGISTVAQESAERAQKVRMLLRAVPPPERNLDDLVGSLKHLRGYLADLLHQTDAEAGGGPASHRAETRQRLRLHLAGSVAVAEEPPGEGDSSPGGGDPEGDSWDPPPAA